MKPTPIAIFILGSYSASCNCNTNDPYFHWSGALNAYTKNDKIWGLSLVEAQSETDERHGRPGAVALLHPQ